MNLASRLSLLFSPKSREKTVATDWHDKYIALLENKSNPVLEINKGEISYFNKIAGKLLELSVDKSYKIKEIFPDFPMDIADYKNPINLKNNKIGEIQILDFIAFNKTNYLLELSLPEKVHTKLLPGLDRPGEKTDETSLPDEMLMKLILGSVRMAYYSYSTENKNNTFWYSEKITELTGLPYEEFQHHPELWMSRIHSDDRKMVKETFDNLSLRGQVSSEYRWIDPNGRITWFLDQATLIPAHENESQKVIGCLIDITERKLAESSIKETEKNYREIFNSSADAIFVHNAFNGKIEDVNNTMLSMFGVTYEEALAADTAMLAKNEKPYDQESAFKHIKTAYETGSDHFEWISSKKDRTLFWTDIILKRITLNGEPKILALVRDINDKKLAEEQIKYRNEFEKLILNVSSGLISDPTHEIDKNFTSSLKQLCDFTKADVGYIYLYDDQDNLNISYVWQKPDVNFPEEKIAHIPATIAAWHTRQIKANQIVALNSTDKIPIKESRFRSFVKHRNLTSFIDVPEVYQGNVIGFIGLAMVSSERKWKEDEISLTRTIGQTLINALKRKESVEALLESEQTHREIYNATSEGIIIHEMETGKIIDANRAVLEMFGYSYDEFLSLNIKNISKNDDTYNEKNAKKLIKKAIHGNPQVFEWHSKRKDNSLFWTEVSIRCVEIKGLLRILAVFRNITERKQAEETLQKNEEKYRLLIEGQTDLVIKIDNQGNLMFVSPSFCELFDKNEEELLGKPFSLLVHKDDIYNSHKSMEQLYRSPHTCYFEQRALTKQGWRWIAWRNKALLDEKKHVKEIIGLGRDITYQKEVEDALRRNEDRFRSIVQQLSDIIFIIDKETVVLYDTPSVQKVLGYEEGFLLGKKGIEFVHPDEQEAVRERVDKLILQNNSVTSIEIRMKHADGRWISLEAVGINMLHHPSINGLLITLRDISERKQVEKRILDAVIKTEEKERESFAKNLHDDLGPLLSSLKMYINSFSTSSDPKKQAFIINQLNEVVKEAITTTKDVSNDLSPHILMNYGLVSAIESFLNKVPSNIKADFRNNLISQRFSNAIENSTYRIIKELVNNTLKHAEATKISITVTENGSDLFLYYADDGKGFRMESLEQLQLKGMGLSNIISRAKSLNSSYEFITAVGKGFTFKITIPIGQTLT